MNDCSIGFQKYISMYIGELIFTALSVSYWPAYIQNMILKFSLHNALTLVFIFRLNERLYYQFSPTYLYLVMGSTIYQDVSIITRQYIDTIGY